MNRTTIRYYDADGNPDPEKNASFLTSYHNTLAVTSRIVSRCVTTTRSFGPTGTRSEPAAAAREPFSGRARLEARLPIRGAGCRPP
mmetsp:Transcript_20912/g.44402  ORF Transcript_20912/g.44402 Transcript_20912/m.44402 type:complete len:86 (-) Transcript_20912:92-349(-)